MSGFRFPQTATYWLPLANNGTGGKTWTVGAKVRAKIAETSKEYLDELTGKRFHARRFIYTEVEIPTGAKVIEGDFNGMTSPVENSQLVKAASSSPNITMFRAIV